MTQHATDYTYILPNIPQHSTNPPKHNTQIHMSIRKCLCVSECSTGKYDVGLRYNNVLVKRGFNHIERVPNIAR